LFLDGLTVGPVTDAGSLEEMVRNWCPIAGSGSDVYEEDAKRTPE
jgi:hypothetical protein